LPEITAGDVPDAAAAGSSAGSAVTTNAAELLGWQARVGAVEPGKFADLVAVAGDPILSARYPTSNQARAPGLPAAELAARA